VITQHWVDKLETTYQAAFLNSTATPFISSNKTEAGYVRSAGHGAGNIAFMAIYEAGHMVSTPVTPLLLLSRMRGANPGWMLRCDRSRKISPWLRSTCWTGG
jgi:hypothetical protein